LLLLLLLPVSCLKLSSPLRTAQRPACRIVLVQAECLQSCQLTLQKVFSAKSVGALQPRPVLMTSASTAM
jgi:hypothetical protein